MNHEDNKLKPMGTQSKETMENTASAAKDAINTTQQSVDHVIDKVSDAVDEASREATSAIDKVSDTANAAMATAREIWHEASDLATDYTKDEPMKALMIAAATGALLVGLLSMMVRSRD